MDPVNQSSSNSKRRLARTFAKVMHIRTMTRNFHLNGVEKTKKHDQDVEKTKLNDPAKHDRFNTDLKSVFEEEEKFQKKASTEAFLAKLFASVSSIKAAYAQMQFSESPYDGEGIQSADEIVVAELKFLSEQKQCYLKNHLDDDPSPETTQVLAEIKEQKSLLKTFEILGKKLDSELMLKHSELTFLIEKLGEANKDNKVIEKRLNMSGGSLSPHENLNLSSLSPGYFIRVLMQTIKSTRSFVRFIISEMESAGWDLDAAANSIEPGVVYLSASHKCFAFESYVCRQMFNGFNHPFFSHSHESLRDTQQQFFSRFIELKSQKPKEYLVWKPKSAFAKFCRKKYLRLIHPKMEESLFGNLDQRQLIGSGSHPETTFYAMFSEMAKRVWQLHCLAFSFQPEASIFQVSKRSRFSEVYMDCVNEEAYLSSSETNPRVAFTVVPGFKIGKNVIKSQVYVS